MRDCGGEVSNSRCRSKYKDYIDYIREKEAKSLMQGEDIQPLVRRWGSLERK